MFIITAGAALLHAYIFNKSFWFDAECGCKSENDIDTGDAFASFEVGNVATCEPSSVG